MFSCKVKNTNKNASVISGTLFLLAMICFGFSIAGIGLRSILQAAMLVLVMFSMLIGERYFIASFEYVINDKVGDYDFVVIRTSGRKSNVVCRLSLSQADKLISVNSTDKEKPAAPGKLYDYTGSMFPQKYYLFTFPEENVTLKLEPSEEFAAALANLIKKPSEAMNGD